MDLTELSRRTSIERRKLRYVLDHQLVPSTFFQVIKDQTGRPRQFNEDGGFAIICAARLLDLGLPHETIRLFLKGLLEFLATRSLFPPPLWQYRSAYCELCDGNRVRIRLDGDDSGWILPDGQREPDKDFAPIALVRLDIGRLSQIFGSSR